MKIENKLIVIPARYKSQRLPGKVLEEIHGFPMIYWVYKQVLKANSGPVVIAADDPKVFKVLETFDIPFIKTDSACRNGTERVYEVSKKYPDVEYFVNCQGDEPLLNPNIIRKVIESGLDKNVFKTAISPILNDFNNPNVVKVALSHNNRIRFASRNLIPYSTNTKFNFYKIHGVYLYSKSLLEKFVLASPGPLEVLESVEQLRCIENDIPLIGVETETTEKSVDTYEDLVYMRNLPPEIFIQNS